MEEAAARRERLKALKAAAALADGDGGGAPAAEEQQQQQEPEKPTLKFRNYVVKDKQRIEHEQASRPARAVRLCCARFFVCAAQRCSATDICKSRACHP